MRATNLEMTRMVEALMPLLERRDVIGYAAARNTRILTDELTEYDKVSNELLVRYGEPELDDDGNETGRVSLDMRSPNFKRYVEEIGPFASIEHEPSVFRIPYESVIGELTGDEILAVDFMLEDAEGGD